MAIKVRDKQAHCRTLLYLAVHATSRSSRARSNSSSSRWQISISSMVSMDGAPAGRWVDDDFAAFPGAGTNGGLTAAAAAAPAAFVTPRPGISNATSSSRKPSSKAVHSSSSNSSSWSLSALPVRVLSVGLLGRYGSNLGNGLACAFA